MNGSEERTLRPSRGRRGGAIWRIAMAVGMAMALLGSGMGAAPTVAVAEAKNSFDLSLVELPYDLGQTSAMVYVPESQHTVRGYFLDYWRANGASSVYGNPISEPFASADGRYSQAFENGIFQYYPELIWTDSPSVLLMPIGKTALASRVDTFRRDGRRGGGGGDVRHTAWSPLPANSSSIQRAITGGDQYDETTGHTITNRFNAWYQSHEGWAYLGAPLSQPVAERGLVVQYFEGGVLMRHSNGAVTLAPLGRELAPTLGIDTTTVAGDGLPVYSETLFWTRDNPNPRGNPDATGRKWIDIDIATQTLRAYQGRTLITETLISTGLEPNETELGTFHVRYKVLKTDMAGTTAPDGSVVEVGTEAAKDPQGNQSTYMVKDVPDVMYINADAEALHGAYWHNNFGNRMSHGCINLPLDMARFLYGWAPLGTMVTVHE